MKTRVLLADDHGLVRAGIRSLLEKIPFVEVVGEAANGRDALSLVQTNRPDIVLIDIAMGDLNGLDAAARMLKEFPQVKVIVLSMHANEQYVARALQSGVSGYLLKDAAAAELDLALQAATRGQRYLSATISSRRLEDSLEQGSGRRGSGNLLTARQQEILQLLAEGKTTKEIAFLLKLSPKTVETHRSQVMDRLQIRDLPGLVRYAIRTGLVAADA